MKTAKKPIKSSSKRRLIKQAVKSAKYQQANKNKEIQTWLSQNRDFKPAGFIEKWEKSRSHIRDKVTELVVDIHALADAVIESNNSVAYSLEMRESGIDISEVDILLRKLAKIQFAQLVIEELHIKQSRDIIDRIVAREFPNRDGRSEDKTTLNQILQKLNTIEQHNMQQPQQHPKSFKRTNTSKSDKEKLLSISTERRKLDK